MRVSPSGKARASQARIRGFESRHPLHLTRQEDWKLSSPLLVSFMSREGTRKHVHSSINDIVVHVRFAV